MRLVVRLVGLGAFAWRGVAMKWHSYLFAALVLAIGLQSQAARAQDNPLSWLFGPQDPRLTVTGIGLGLGADAGYFALRKKHGYPVTRLATSVAAYGMTTFGCAALFPIVGTIVLNRPLTPREVYMGVANCVVPIIGGWIVNAALPHDAWTDGLPPAPPRHHHK
jgi:hypothetical protein